MSQNPRDPFTPPPPPRQPIPAIPVEPLPDDTPADAHILDDDSPQHEIPLAQPAPPPPLQSPPPYLPPPQQYYNPYPPPPQWSAPPVYTQPGAGRPGSVTTIGVMSIIVASLSIIGSLFSGCAGLSTRNMAQQTAMMSKMTFPTTTPSSAWNTPAPAPPPPPLLVPSQNALGPADRQAITRALASKRRLSPDRRKQLDAFLTEHGKLVFQQQDQTPITPQAVTQHLGDTGQEFAGANKTGPDFFDLKEGALIATPGRLTLHDDRALFRPEDGSPPLRSAADQPQSNTNVTTPAPKTNALPPGIPGEGLSPEEARAVINRIGALASNMLNPQQVQTLKNQLESSAYQALIQPSTTTPGLTAQVKSAVVQDDGSVTINFAMGAMTLDPNGQITSATTTYVPPNPAATNANNPNNPFGPVAWGTMSVNTSATTLVAAEAALSFLLAIFLLVTGILVLRQTPAARKLLLLYATLKLLAGVLGIIALSWMIKSITASDPNSAFAMATNMARMAKGMSTAALVITSAGLIFPLAVLILMLASKEIKDYYKNA